MSRMGSRCIVLGVVNAFAVGCFRCWIGLLLDGLAAVISGGWHKWNMMGTTTGTMVLDSNYADALADGLLQPAPRLRMLIEPRLRMLMRKDAGEVEVGRGGRWDRILDR